MNEKWKRRDSKKRGAWYKRHLANNRKALEIIIQARLNRYVKQLSKEPKDEDNIT